MHKAVISWDAAYTPNPFILNEWLYSDVFLSDPVVDKMLWALHS